MKISGLVLLISACLGPVYGQRAAGANTSEAVQQLERDWTAAEKAADADKLNQILADDWVGINADGTTVTKQQFLDDVKSGKTKLESVDFGPMHVKVIGNVAVVQGSDTEKGTVDGKDNSGKFAWMDVFEKHNGKWQAVRSQTAKVM